MKNISLIQALYGILLVGCLFSFKSVYAQHCGTVVYQKLLDQRNIQLENKEDFENWLKNKIEQPKQNVAQGREEATVYTIPVVVHVIHIGEDIGTGRNIPDAQIISQIDVLNEDYRRMNADAANTPAIFQPVAADVELQFALAKRDPEGLPTNGIVRLNGVQPEWEIAENYALKRLSYWPAEDYLNIWVTNIEGNYLGYAQFPTTNTLAGLEDGSDNRETDGIVIDYKAFGSKAKFPEASLSGTYNLGRTTTHEIGHYFGLRHIWGDVNGCGGSDYVNDTPNQSTSYSSCPSESSDDSCGSRDMYQNYMDYSYDECMNLFTLDQKSRIRTILNNSPRRVSLKTSKGNIAPTMVSNDLGIRNLFSPEIADCADTTTPVIEIRNYGNNVISSAEITVKVNGSLVQTRTFSLSLDPLAIDTVQFDEFFYTNNAVFTFTFEIRKVNNATDNGPENNTLVRNVKQPASVLPPLNVKFNGLPANWEIQNPDGNITWQIFPAPNGEPNNKALGIEFYNYENGEVDIFSSPAINLTTAALGVLTFDVAYADFSGISKEGLLVTANRYCGAAFIGADTLFYKTGRNLGTASSTGYFVPGSASDWRTEAVDLEKYLGTKISLAFIGINGFGNNLYLDNIAINITEKTDVAVKEIISPSPASCEQAPLQFSVENRGTSPVGYLEITYQLDSMAPEQFIWQSDGQDSIPVSGVRIFEFPLPDYDSGRHNILVAVNKPNQKLDIDQTDNTMRSEFYLNNNMDIIPIKENFESFAESDWLVANGDNKITWDTVTTETGTALYIKNKAYTFKNQRDWLISPVLNFKNARNAILSFDVAYAGNGKNKDVLTILGSDDCGAYFNISLFEEFGNDLHTADFNGEPASSDWRTIDLNIDQFLGEEEVRLAFVSTNYNGENIYLDNIEVFVTENSVKRINEIYPNPSSGIFKITFDLPKKENVSIIIYDAAGKIHYSGMFANTLNQTYNLDLRNESAGIYLVKVVSESNSYVKRIMVQP